ncbi:alpha/beta hydrolase [Roseibacillus ishigakijimensis]|uniref:Alpha/beta hydrolase n=1 Tax=Roseibacillus ishigakijimensis TaxID=454146 RepID=A0A934RNR0_9BACT|nr:alpha/beta hydrolase-fold protein [Roseibacillus ishigakijimensis]MBK1833022.1 alpha/beta hydrolase [Roseibacillus ishigakijimensis]
MVKSLLISTLLSLSTFSGSVLGQDDAPAQPYQQPGCVQWEMVAASGTEYRIMVSLPEEEAPAGGFPVAYLLDGNALFPLASSLYRVQAGTAKLRKHNGISSGIIVGIGYVGDSQRDYEYTPEAEPTSQPETYRNGQPYPPREYGGAARLRAFIEDELKPEIEKRYPVDPSQQALVGNGFGGVFVLHTLFTAPDSFHTYVAGSPSIWWNGRSILEQEKAFRAQPAAARLLLTVGEGEQSLTRVETNWADEDAREEHRLKVTSRRMVDNARELFWRLDDLDHSGFEVEYASFAGESHKSAIPMSLSRALPFLFPPQEAGEKE